MTGVRFVEPRQEVGRRIRLAQCSRRPHPDFLRRLAVEGFPVTVFRPWRRCASSSTFEAVRVGASSSTRSISCRYSRDSCATLEPSVSVVSRSATRSRRAVKRSSWDGSAGWGFGLDAIWSPCVVVWGVQKLNGFLTGRSDLVGRDVQSGGRLGCPHPVEKRHRRSGAMCCGQVRAGVDNGGG